MIEIKHVGVQRKEHIQTEASALWTVVHNLNKPSIIARVLIDGIETLPLGVNCIDDNSVEIEFSQPRSGSVIII
jgi:hypothetical protein